MGQKNRQYKEVKKSLDELGYYAHGLFVSFHEQLFLKNKKINKKSLKVFSDEIISIIKDEKDFDNEECYNYFRDAINLIMDYFEFADVPEDQTYLGMLEVYKYMSKYSIKEDFKTTFELFLEDLENDESVEKKIVKRFRDKLTILFKEEESVKNINSVTYFGYYLKQYCINHEYSVINNDISLKRFNRMIENNKSQIKRYYEMNKRRRTQHIHMLNRNKSSDSNKGD